MIFSKRLLDKGCAYLAYAIDTNISEERLGGIPMVRYYLDVFSKELPCLLRDKDSQFTIDLIRGIAPIL